MLECTKDSLILLQKKITSLCVEIAPELLDIAQKSNQPIDDVVNRYLWLKQTRSDYEDLKLSKKSLKRVRSGKLKFSEEEILDLIKYRRDKLDELYERVNPELAALRKKEKEDIVAGVDPKTARENRRLAVMAYYKSQQNVW